MNFRPTLRNSSRGSSRITSATSALPLAVAGPLVVRGSYAEGTYYVPLCTVEGTLAISMTRGAYLTSLSGGILTRHLKQEVSRSPVFIFPDVDACQPFLAWVEAELPAIRAGGRVNHPAWETDPGRQVRRAQQRAARLRLQHGRRRRAEHGDPREPRRLPLHQRALSGLDLPLPDRVQFQRR